MDDDFKTVRDLGVIMASQNNRGTQYPLYAVQVDKKVYMPHAAGWDYDGYERKDPDVEHVDDWYLCTDCQEKREKGKQLPDECDDCSPECFNWYMLEAELDMQPGLFLTELGCQNHIDANSYHYQNPRVYAVSAWRNYEMQAVMRQVIKAGDAEVPSHYA